jgi:hypothetical protein
MKSEANNNNYTVHFITMPRTRRFFQIRIGNGNDDGDDGNGDNDNSSSNNKYRVADVVLHVRRCDINWFDEEQIMDHVLDLLQESIVPRWDNDRYANEIALGPQGIPMASTTNKGMAAAAAAATNNNAKLKKTNNNNNKRPRGGKKPTKAELAERQRLDRERAKMKDGGDTSKEAYYASNDTIKLVYKWEAALGGAVLVPAPQQQRSADNHAAAAAVGGGWVECTKFSKRLLLWCYPTSSTDLPAGGGEGLLRPELIPLADLFRRSSSNSNNNKEEE